MTQDETRGLGDGSATALGRDAAGLVRRVQRGDLIAMGDLLDLLSPYVDRLCGPIALQDGPDAVQETLIAVFRGIGTLRTPEAVWGWVRAIAVREAVRVARRRRVEAELFEVPSTQDVELAVDIAGVLDRLTPEHRAVLVLRDVAGLSEQEAAEVLVLPVGTAMRSEPPSTSFGPSAGGSARGRRPASSAGSAAVRSPWPKPGARSER